MKPRARISLLFENPGLADKWFDEMTKHTERGTLERQFGLPLWMLEARGEALPQVFMDCVSCPFRYFFFFFPILTHSFQVRYIYYHLQQPEMFKKSGDMDDLKFLRGEYDRGIVPNLERITDPLTIGGLLKSFLSELKHPLLTYAFYSEFMTAMKLDEAQRFAMFQQSIAKIPKMNQRILWISSQLWKMIHDQSAVNGMTAANLSVVFAPKVIQPKQAANLTLKMQPVWNQLVESFILHGDQIFSTAIHSVPPDWTFILDANRPQQPRFNCMSSFFLLLLLSLPL